MQSLQNNIPLKRSVFLSFVLYKENQGLNYKGGFKVKKGRNWSAKAINRIIENEVYIGTMLQGKSATINYKNKKQIEKDKRDWVKVEDTHEGIISKEVFYIANRMLKRDLYNTQCFHLIL